MIIKEYNYTLLLLFGVLVASIFKKNFSFITFNKVGCEAHLLRKKRLLRMSQVASVCYDVVLSSGRAIMTRSNIPFSPLNSAKVFFKTERLFIISLSNCSSTSHS